MRSIRLRRLVTIASTALLALVLIGPSQVTAATPLVYLAATGPTPAVVSPGETVYFTASLQNADSSTISQLSVTTTIPFGVAYASAVGGSCATTSPLSCTFRNVKPFSTVSIAVVLVAPSSGTSFGVQFKWDTTGQAGDRGGNSHGDSFWYPYAGVVTTPGDPIQVGLNGDTTNFRSRYVVTSTQQTVANDQAVSSANRHATKVVAPTTMLGVTVSDGTTTACPGGLSANCFSETSVVEVAAGATFPGGFKIVITMDGSEIPSGVNANNVEIAHWWTSPTPGQELISAHCTFSGGLPTNMSCLTAKKVNGSDLEVTIWVTHNGSLRGTYG